MTDTSPSDIYKSPAEPGYRVIHSDRFSTRWHFLIKTFCWLAEWLCRRVHTWQWPSLQILSCTLTRIGYRKTAGRLAAEKTAKWKMMFAEGTCENISFGFITTKRLSSLNRSPKRPSGYQVNQMWLRAPCVFHQCKCHAGPCKWFFWGECLISCQWSFVKWQCWHGCELTSVKLKAQKHTH